MFEEYTEDYFMEKAREMGEELGVDTRQGSVYMDAVTGHCFRVAKFYSDLSSVFEMLAIDTCAGDILNEKASEKQIYRKEATPSLYECTFEGVTEIEILGDRFMVGDFYFVLIENDDGYYLQSETAGSFTNFITSGTNVIPVRNTMGLVSATLGKLYIAGTDQETDENLRERYKNSLKFPSENGNKQQYKIWCESYEGIGRAVITPLAYGANTVKALLISADGMAPTEALIGQIQQDIDPNSEGLGEGLSFIGCKFYAVAATECAIDIAFDAVLTSESIKEVILENAKDKIAEYLKDISLHTSDGELISVQYVKVVAMLADTEGIRDFSNLTLNGENGNVYIDIDSVPVLGEVDMSVSV